MMAFKIPRKPVQSTRAVPDSTSGDSRPSHMQSIPHSDTKVQVQPLLTGRTSVSSMHRSFEAEDGPSQHKDIVSVWHVSSSYPALMAASYVAALFAAFGHLLFFLNLNGTHVEEHTTISQGNVTTISNLVANVWSVCLSCCLAMAFTQSFWNLVRNKYLSVATIDKLYGLFRNIFQARFSLIVVAPVSCFITVFAWSVAILKTLPPGALTVVGTSFTNTTQLHVPTLNLSDIGNFSKGLTSTATPLGIFSPSPASTNESRNSLFEFGYDLPFPLRMNLEVRSQPLILSRGPLLPTRLRPYVRAVLISREPARSVSPCGANCSYLTQIEGPYLDCETTTRNTTWPSETLSQAENRRPVPKSLRFALAYNTTYDTYGMRILQHKQIRAPAKFAHGSWHIQWTRADAKQREIKCQFATARYTVNISYTNGSRSISNTVSRPTPLAFQRSCVKTNIRVNPLAISCGRSIPGVPLRNRTMTDEVRPVLRGLKAYALISHLGQEINGTAPADCGLWPNTTHQSNGTNILFCTTPIYFIRETEVFDTFFYKVVRKPSTEPRLHTIFFNNLDITAALLNEALFNITMTYVFSYMNPETQEVAAQRSYWLLTYEFSRPLNLILPYFIPLALAVPIVIHAMFTVYWRNYVDAIEDSFVQILMTTTGSNAINQVAAGGCLGGENNVPNELKRLKIKYGDITRSFATHNSDKEDTEYIRRAGFGVEGEVEPLRRRARYGVRLPEEIV